MHYISTYLKVGSLALYSQLLIAASTHASFSIDQGWDLLYTLPGTEFLGVPFTGVGIGDYDFDNEFGRNIGVRNVGTVDTIIRRNEIASVLAAGQSDTIDIDIVKLQLQTVAPTTFGGLVPLDLYFATLVSDLGSTETIRFGAEGDPHGTFDTEIKLAFALHKGALDGPIVPGYEAFPKTFTSTGNPWRHDPTGFPIIDLVNHKLPVNGSVPGPDTSHDFWPIGGVWHDAGNATHVVATPEPATFCVGLALVGVCLSGGRRARSRKALV